LKEGLSLSLSLSAERRSLSLSPSLPPSPSQDIEDYFNHPAVKYTVITTKIDMMKNYIIY
jgi:hypothetical protein